MPLLTGRRPRKHDPRVPHASALRSLALRHGPLPPIPIALDYSTASGRLPADLGMMANDVLGCCTAAACYHAHQVWTDFAQGAVDTQPDSEVVRWYRECSGYDPARPETDVGAVEQDVLTRWVTVGAPQIDGTRDRLVAFVELDVRDVTAPRDDVRRAIYECGVVYLGFLVPRYLMETPEPPQFWDRPNEPTEGGHAVVAVGYDATSLTVISWGKRYKMTDAFWLSYVDEAYALVDDSWVEQYGRTPLGLTLDELRQQMAALRG